MERCSGRTATLPDVSWYRTVAGAPLIINGKSGAGAWFRSGNRIALANESGPVVRHEMLHAILQDGLHPGEVFAGRCGSYVAFEGTDLYQISAADTVDALTIHDGSALEVSVTLYRPHEQILSYDGSVLLLVRVTNRGPSGWMNIPNSILAHVEDQDNGEAQVVYTRSKRVFLRGGGAVRTVAVDGRVSNVNTMRVQAGFVWARSAVTILPLN